MLLRTYYGASNNELQMPMDLMFTSLKLSAPAYRQHIAAVNASGVWPTYVITNHDIVRSYTRNADGVHDDQIAKVLAGLYLTLRGTPILYYGEELGMQNNDPKREGRCQGSPSASSAGHWRRAATANALPCSGPAAPTLDFTKDTPWLPVPDSSKTHNVETGKQGCQFRFIFLYSGSASSQGRTRPCAKALTIALLTNPIPMCFPICANTKTKPFSSS